VGIVRKTAVNVWSTCNGPEITKGKSLEMKTTTKIWNGIEIKGGGL
jgi:hypothetical protein